MRLLAALLLPLLLAAEPAAAADAPPLPPRASLAAAAAADLPPAAAVDAPPPPPAAAPPSPPPPPSLADAFIVRRGARLFFDIPPPANATTTTTRRRPFYFVGANMLFPTDVAHRPDPIGRRRTARALDALADAGVSVVRVWGFNRDMPRVVAATAGPAEGGGGGDAAAAAAAAAAAGRGEAGAGGGGPEPPPPRLLYDRAQVAALDYVVWAAKRRGLRVVVTLGNLWRAYKALEEFAYPAAAAAEEDDDDPFGPLSEVATGAAADAAAAAAERDGADVGDFYAASSPRFARAAAAYRRHAYALVTRLNPLTGLRYNEDPAVMGYALLNEPRYPGGFGPGDQRAHWRWVSGAAAFVQSAAPRQLVSASTEGFFVENNGDGGGGGGGEAGAAIAASARAARAGDLLHHNSGAGGACEGEDFLSLSSAPAVGVATAHLYERQAEWRPEPSGSAGDDPNWMYCQIEACYLPWLRSAVALRAALSGAGGAGGERGGERAADAVAAAAAEDAIAGAAAARVLLPANGSGGGSPAPAAFDGLAKAFVVEEFGITWHRATLEQRASAFRLVLGMARRAAAAGTTTPTTAPTTTPTAPRAGDGMPSLAGAMFWQASGNDTDDSDGYVVRIDRPGVVAAAREAAAAAGGPALTALPLPSALAAPRLATPDEAEAYVAREAAAVEAALRAAGGGGGGGGGGNASRWWDPSAAIAAAPPELAAQMAMMPAAVAGTAAGPVAGGPVPLAPPPPPPLPPPPPPPPLLVNALLLAPALQKGGSRSLLYGQDTLDAFRRGPQREACAVEASKTWRPHRSFNLTAWRAPEDDRAAWRDLAPEQRRAAARALAEGRSRGGWDGGDASVFEVALTAALVNARVYGHGGG
jgi:hypothetical protein